MTYTARITSGVKDQAGNALLSDYTWSFTTDGGSLDTSFGERGVVVTAVSGGNDRINALAIQSDDRLIAAGISKFFGREAVSFLLVLPIALPGIVTGIALRSAIGTYDIPFSFWTIIIGHATFCVVVVYNVLARFRRMQGSQIEASMDLGANSFQTFRYVVFPNIATALLAGGMLAFALSFDEVIVTTFTAGQQTTLPIWIFSQLTRPATGL